MLRLPPRATRTDSLFPCTTLFRSTPLRVLEADLKGRCKQLSQDLRLSSDFDGPFNFIFGAYYNIEKLWNETSAGFYSDIDVNGDGALTWEDCVDSGFAVSCIYRNNYKQEIGRASCRERGCQYV